MGAWRFKWIIGPPLSVIRGGLWANWDALMRAGQRDDVHYVWSGSQSLGGLFLSYLNACWWGWICSHKGWIDHQGMDRWKLTGTWVLVSLIEGFQQPGRRKRFWGGRGFLAIDDVPVQTVRPADGRGRPVKHGIRGAAVFWSED